MTSNVGETHSLDCRGLTCPEPVLRTKKLFDSQSTERVEALVDDEVNVQNLSRLGRSLQLRVDSIKQGDHFLVVLQRDFDAPVNVIGAKAAAAVDATSTDAATTKTDTVIFISKNSFGDGDAEFSLHLLNLFLQTYFSAGHRPRAILMANSGVKLMEPNSPFGKVLDDFRQAGCAVYACGLCLEYYGLTDIVNKDEITNMFAIVEYIEAAAKVITP